jgi:hypothetical protein
MDASGSIEEAFVKEAQAEIDGGNAGSIQKSSEMLRRKRRDASEVLKSHVQVSLINILIQ